MLQAEAQVTPIAFADPIKKIAMDIYGFTYDQVYGNSKEIPDPRWDGLTPRHAMQQIGTEVARSIHPDTWIRYCLSTIRSAAKGHEPLIHWEPARGFVPARLLMFEWEGEGVLSDLQKWAVTDVRFPNEADHIRAAGGKVIKVVRPALEGKQGDTHASETSIDEIEPDILLINDGTRDDLLAQVRTVLPSLF
jgi:hypothetical protein